MNKPQLASRYGVRTDIIRIVSKEPRDLPIVGDRQPDGPKFWIEL
jgi:hypothetical protein